MRDKIDADAVNQLAFWAAAIRRINIQQNGQIDTGFMTNSVGYVVSEEANTFDQTDASGQYTSRKSARSVERTR